MLKHLLQKILHSVTGSKHSNRRYSSSHRFNRPMRRGSSSDRYGSGYGQRYYKNRHGSSS
ncbi:hypothetical protein [Paenibacillus mucilaginosus]|uniref:Uncharacterized protein n=3 Tax=Paenibacillus mucilaginosus TaxID=61624 RepID=H6NQU0_9BACL|nr:hypothetical protein [Paenibacillus mucilaginosus]AEI38947.1 hypothetical protein KNP414_00322 [Paenibacillus mucilaginosus KNP414]AFC27254.1 hypothetical protein PM3016_278 [Paenibacillus mucilaginosus 3016]AFH59395.1 hypothetical protein B2K_01410 [Paenibacillus mucilaginosus K02]MCG7216569.1 hypothetical protein [Paenibacillus mucilaginosus]WDM31490.1 hypothetical protein KCX80_01560 [Paenibacillus mucilaginosus]